MERQALLIARWMHVGFVHGVMNTDNTALSGETIDFGPCAFMDLYDPATAFSAIDEFGRYAYANQPTLRNGISRGSPRPCFRSWIPTQSGRSNLRARRSPPTAAWRAQPSVPPGRRRRPNPMARPPRP